MDFYEAFTRICKLRGTSPSNVLDAIKMGRSAITHWKKGVKPSNATLKLISDYFEITIDELESGVINGSKKEKKPAKPKVDELSEYEYEIIKNFRQMTEEEKRAFEVFVKNTKR